MQLQNQPGFFNELARLLGQQPTMRESSNVIDVRKLADAIEYSRQVANESNYAQGDHSAEQQDAAQKLGLGPSLFDLSQLLGIQK